VTIRGDPQRRCAPAGQHQQRLAAGKRGQARQAGVAGLLGRDDQGRLRRRLQQNRCPTAQFGDGARDRLQDRGVGGFLGGERFGHGGRLVRGLYEAAPL